MWEERQRDKNCGFAPCDQVATRDATNCEIGRRPLEGVISGQLIVTAALVSESPFEMMERRGSLALLVPAFNQT